MVEFYEFHITTKFSFDLVRLSPPTYMAVQNVFILNSVFIRNRNEKHTCLVKLPPKFIIPDDSLFV